MTDLPLLRGGVSDAPLVAATAAVDEAVTASAALAVETVFRNSRREKWGMGKGSADPVHLARKVQLGGENRNE